MKFSNVRLLVKDYRKCFEFYTQQFGLEAVWDIEECYASFKVADGIEGVAIFTSDLIAPVVGNTDKIQPVKKNTIFLFSRQHYFCAFAVNKKVVLKAMQSRAQK